jgi:hypothetical protein
VASRAPGYARDMVRRDEAGRVAAKAGGRAASRCACPAGASPASVSAGAPGSRPQVAGEIPQARAGRRKPAKRQLPRSGEQARGPQHEVKPAASTEQRSGSRAAHVTAKAMSTARGPERVVGPGGVWGAARAQGEVRNTRGPSPSPSSRQGGSYKPKAKSSAAERESEGLVVPTRVVQHNATGGKGPCFGRVEEAGIREGMAGKTGPNDPDERLLVVQACRRNRLWIEAEARGGQRRRMDPRRGDDVPLRHANHVAAARCMPRRREAIGKPCAGNPHARFERGPWRGGMPRASHCARVYQ